MNRRAFAKRVLAGGAALWVPQIIAAPPPMLQRMISRPGKIPLQSSAFVYYATAFDGSSYMRRLTGLTCSDGKEGFLSVWVKRSTTDSTRVIFCTGGGMFYFRLSTTNTFTISGSNSTPTVIMSYTSSATLSTAWNHILASWDLTNSSNRYVYLNGALEGGSWATYTDDSIHYSHSSDSAHVCSTVGGGSRFTGSISECYFATSYLSVATALSYFRNGTHPQNPSGCGLSPIAYLNNPYGTLNDNSGSGGDYTVVGTLTDDPSIP